MASCLGFDASYISRINSGERVPANKEEFINSICRYIVETYTTNNDKNSIAHILKVDISELEDETYLSKLQEWFYTNNLNNYTSVGNFLEKLDNFNLSEYIKTIHFDEIKVPTMPFQLASSKNYYGTEEMRNGELDFFKHTVLSKTKEPIFMYNDMPMEDMAKDVEFGKKWMFAIAVSLKKGLHLNMVHNLNRPFNELMLGLESWIPIYMTGQVTPYYFKTSTNSIFNHTLYVSEVAALIGEGVNGCHSNSKYYVTSKKTELPFYQSMSKDLLKKASSLMDIYVDDNVKNFYKFISSEKEKGDTIIIESQNLNNTFKNIEFTICKGKWVAISKKVEPTIHFVIHNPILRDAIENFIAPVVE